MLPLGRPFRLPETPGLNWLCLGGRRSPTSYSGHDPPSAVSFPRSALSLSLEFDTAALLRRLGFRPDDPRPGSFGPVVLSQPQGAQERSRRRNAAPFVLPFVRTGENDRKRRARGCPPRHTIADVECVRVLS